MTKLGKCGARPKCPCIPIKLSLHLTWRLPSRKAATISMICVHLVCGPLYTTCKHLPQSPDTKDFGGEITILPKAVGADKKSIISSPEGGQFASRMFPRGRPVRESSSTFPLCRLSSTGPCPAQFQSSVRSPASRTP
jgi:hypothetical protein